MAGLGFIPVVLRTDALLFVLIGMVVAFALYARRRPHLWAPWQAVLRRPLGAATLLVLAVYVAIAVLDSVHLRLPLPQTAGQAEVQYASEVVSVLDLLARPLREHVEKTYSAPFALHLFVKETVESGDGPPRRIHPRLVHGGAHLADPAQRGEDILGRLARGGGIGLMVWGGLWGLVGLVRAGRSAAASRGGPPVPWRTLLTVTAVLAMLVAGLCELAPVYHVLGTDKVGEDVLYQAIKSVRTALLIGTLTTLIMLPFAILMGIMAGYLRGRVDDLIQYLYTTLNSIPGVLLIASSVLLLQVYIEGHAEDFQSDAARADLRLLFLCIILGVTSWTGLCRLLRGEAMKLGGVDFVEAARAFGVRPLRIMLRHLLPNVMHIVLISVVLDFSGLVLAEAVLSYVGVGVDPSMHSWGNMINSARLEMAREPMVWWSLFAAFVFMFVLVLAANLFSDCVRDVFDPRQGRA